MSLLALDHAYTKAEGGYLYYKKPSGQTQAVMDFIGGYGSLLLGHNHPDVKVHLMQLLAENRPIHSQLAFKERACDLGAFISEALGQISDQSYVTTLCNSGAEAVEAAIKHAALSFSKRKNMLLVKLQSNLHEIRQNFSKQNKRFSVEFNGKDYSEFHLYEAAVLATFKASFEVEAPVLLAAKRSFHGKTTGALSLTHNERFREGFDLGNWANVRFFDHTKSDFLQYFTESVIQLSIPKLMALDEIGEETQHFSNLLGVIVEPVQGEGGVRVLSTELLKVLRSVTKQYCVPLIFDEIQSGSYRTGKFCYANRVCIDADYFCLSKALGGGYAKISALVINAQHYDSDFDILHTSTYADDEVSASVALKALEISKRYSHLVQSLESHIGYKLNQLCMHYPDVIMEVQGCGLMWGISFLDLDTSANLSFQMFSRNGFLVYLFASYLLNKWHIRVAPTLSGNNGVKILPCLFITEEEIDLLYSGLSSLCEIVRCRDFYKLIEHLLDPSCQALRDLVDFGQETISIEKSLDTESNAGFVAHYIDTSDVQLGDPSLGVLPKHEIDRFLALIIDVAVPVLCQIRIIENNQGKKVSLHVAGLFFTSDMAKEALIGKDLESYVSLIQRAVDFLAEDYSCSHIGLGQYNSILTNNGKSIQNLTACITTGNSYTVAAGVEVICRRIFSANSFVSKPAFSLGVLGAAGNICSTYVKALLPYFSRFYLKGGASVDSDHKVFKFVETLLIDVFNSLKNQDSSVSLHPDFEHALRLSETYQHFITTEALCDSAQWYQSLILEMGEKSPLQVKSDLDFLSESDVVVIATSSPEAFLNESHFKFGSLVCDVSVPSNLKQAIFDNNKNIEVVRGGLVDLPNEESLYQPGYRLDKGVVYACIAETLVLALEGVKGDFSIGDITPIQVAYIRGLAERNGFLIKQATRESVF